MSNATTPVTCPVDGVPVGDDDCCPVCQVMAGPPCLGCGEAMYHTDDCPEMAS